MHLRAWQLQRWFPSKCSSATPQLNYAAAAWLCGCMATLCVANAQSWADLLQPFLWAAHAAPLGAFAAAQACPLQAEASCQPLELVWQTADCLASPEGSVGPGAAQLCAGISQKW